MHRKTVLLPSAVANLILVLFPCGVGAEDFHILAKVFLIITTKGSNLVKHLSVQKELNLSPGQVAELKDVVKQMQKAAFGLNALDKKEAAKKLLEINAWGAKTASDLLKPEQLRRFQQVQLQVACPLGFLDDDVAKELKLALHQRKSIKKAYNEGRREVILDHLKAKKMGKDSLKKIVDFNAAATAKILKILTEDQRRKYLSMVGPPFIRQTPFISGPIYRQEPKDK